MKISALKLLLISIYLVSYVGFAEDQINPLVCNSQASPPALTESTIPAVPDALSALNFGIGIGASSIFDSNHINSATVENNIVRITDNQSISREFWFETHYLLHQGCINSIRKPYGVGPFVAVSLIDENGFFNSLGTGLMLSLKRTDIKDKDTSAFNIGLGVKFSGYDVLGDGQEANKPLPEGEENVRLKNVTGLGWILMFSFSF